MLLLLFDVVHVRHVLTAAHCRLRPGRHKAYLGSSKLREKEVPFIVEISSFDVHRAYKRARLTSDVALVTLKDPPKKQYLKQKGISPIHVDWKVSRSGDGRKMFAIGFGVTKAEARASPSRELRNGTIYKLNTETCVSRWYRAADRDTVLCAQSKHTTTVCSGDSGGPIVVYKTSRSGQKRLYLLGIISAVISTDDEKCCDPGAPVLSMNIEPYKRWVERRVGNHRRW